MTAKLFFSVILVTCTFQHTGAEASPHLSASQLQALSEDEVSLLQATVEVKKAKHSSLREEQAGEEEQNYGKAFCETCGSAGATSSFKTVAPETVAAPEEEPVKQVAQASSSVLGTVLQALACLLIVDVLRRKGQSSEKMPAASSPKAAATKASTQPDSAASLLKAALAGDVSTFEATVGSCLSHLSRADNWGCTVMHYAAKGGSASIVKRLLDLGASVNALDAWDETPLHLAARAGHAEACEALLAAGARIDSMNAEECTPLVVAGQAEQQAICALLIEQGAGIAGLAAEMVPDILKGLLPEQVDA